MSYSCKELPSDIHWAHCNGELNKAKSIFLRLNEGLLQVSEDGIKWVAAVYDEVTKTLNYTL